MKVKFYLDSKITSSGESAIWCYVREYDKTFALNTGEKIKPVLWDKILHRANLKKEKDKIKKGVLNDINQYLNTIENKIHEITRLVRSKDFTAGFSIIVDEMKKQFNKREVGFFSIYDEFVSLKNTEVTKPTIVKLNRIKALLEEYEKFANDKLNFEKLTPIFFQKFYTFLITKKNLLNNTAHKDMQFLKSFLIWANLNKYTTNEAYKSFKVKSESNEVIYLTEEELMKLYNLTLHDNDRLARVRDVFVFQCLTGCRHSDLQNLKNDDITSGVWHLRTQKTRQIIDIPLNGMAISLLAKYSGYPTPLPVISNQKMNDYLKELCELAEIDAVIKTVKYQGNERIEHTYKKYEVIGTHTARRTFISLSLQKGMQAEVIMSITGHSDYKMMRKYLKIADGHKREEMDKVWGSSVRLL
jgi:integrase